MQRDTTLASSKVGVSVFKLIVVLAQNRHFSPFHIPSEKNCPFQSTTSWSLAATVTGTCAWRWSLKVKQLVGIGKTAASSSWHWIQRMSLCLCSFWEEVDKSHIILSGSGRRHRVPSGPLGAPATSLPQLLTHMLTARAHWKSEADVRSCSASQLISLQERRFGVRETKSEWWAADGVSRRIKHVLISTAMHCQQWCECEKTWWLASLTDHPILQGHSRK